MVLVEKLGKYIERLDRPNSNLRYGIDDVCGITNTKQLVLGTKANLIGRTFEKFSILGPREFIFNRRTSRNGERISLGFNNTDRDWILTEDYCHFRIQKDKEDILDPDFLYLFFQNPEFDRYARFNSWGSATEFFNWEEIIETPIPILSISEQRKIVHDYQAVTDRIELLRKMNGNLEETMETIFKSFVSEKGQDGFETVYKIFKVINGTAFSSDYYNTDMNGYPLVRIRDLSTCNPDVFTSEVLPGIEYVNAGDILVGMDGEFIPHVWYGDTGVLNQRVCKIVPVNQNIHPMFLLWTLKPILAEIQRTQGGTTVIHIGKKDFDKMVCANITEEKHKDYYEKVDPMFRLLVLNNREILKLLSIGSMIRSSMFKKLGA